MEELERMKVEEMAKVGVSGSKMLLVHSSSNINELLIFIVDWSTIPSISPFSLGLFTDLGISNTVETFFDIRLGF